MNKFGRVLIIIILIILLVCVFVGGIYGFKNLDKFSAKKEIEVKNEIKGPFITSVELDPEKCIFLLKIIENKEINNLSIPIQISPKPECYPDFNLAKSGGYVIYVDDQAEEGKKVIRIYSAKKNETYELEEFSDVDILDIATHEKDYLYILNGKKGDFANQKINYYQLEDSQKKELLLPDIKTDYVYLSQVEKDKLVLFDESAKIIKQLDIEEFNLK